MLLIFIENDKYLPPLPAPSHVINILEISQFSRVSVPTTSTKASVDIAKLQNGGKMGITPDFSVFGVGYFLEKHKIKKPQQYC